MEGPSLTGGGTKRTPSKSQLKAAEFLGEEQFGKELRDKVHTELLCSTI